MEDPNIINIISKTKEKVGQSDWSSILGSWLDSDDHVNVVKSSCSKQ